MSIKDQDYRIYQEEKEPMKGKATKVYSINREKLKETIKILDEISNRYKDMLSKDNEED